MDQSKDLFPEADKNSFEAAFAWWEKRRLRYNIAVGIPGVVMDLLTGPTHLNLWSIAFIFLFGVMANSCYCLGYLIEFFLKYYFKSAVDFAEKRNNFYWIGTTFSIFVVIGGGLLELFTQPGITNFVK